MRKPVAYLCAASMVALSVSAAVGAPRSSAKFTTCVFVPDDRGDQRLLANVPQTSGYGPQALDLLSTKITGDATTMTVTWVLAALSRPAPSQTYGYLWFFGFGQQSHYQIIADIQAIGSPPQTPVTDRFLLAQADTGSGLTPSAPHYIAGVIDFGHSRISVTFKPSDLGMSSFRGARFLSPTSYTENTFGNTVGIASDSSAFPADVIAGRHQGC